MNVLEYWKECVSIGADECGAVLTDEQLEYIAGSVESGHEHYGMAFYSPPPSDRYNEIEREWKAKYEALRKEFDAYIDNAETAVKTALRQHRDASVSIGKYGEVHRIDGRITRIQ